MRFDLEIFKYWIRNVKVLLYVSHMYIVYIKRVKIFPRTLFMPPTALFQGSGDTDVSFPAVAAAGPGADGKRCIDKVQ